MKNVLIIAINRLKTLTILILTNHLINCLINHLINCFNRNIPYFN